MSGAPGGSAGSGHGSDPDEEALQRRIREFLRHGTAAEAGVEEWGEFAAQLRFLREELPLEERQALLERWDRMLSRALPDLQLAAEQRESVLLALEAAAAEGRLGRRSRTARHSTSVIPLEVNASATTSLARCSLRPTTRT